MSKQEIGYLWTDTIDASKKRIGLSSHGLKHLGNIEWIGLPDIGRRIQKDEPLFVVESSKAAIEIESPFCGTVQAVQPCTEIFVKQLLSEPDVTWLLELELLP